MVFFKTNYFTFNKQPSQRMDLQMCQITEGNDMIAGLSRNIQQTDNGINDIKYLQSVSNEYVEITCNMARIEGCNVLPLTDEYMFEVNRWLWKKEFLPLEFNGFTLNVMVKSMTKTQFNKNKEGYLTVTFLAEPYMISNIVKTYKVFDYNEFELYNKSNADNYIYIDYIDIDLVEGDYIKIKNMTNGSEFNIENLNSNSKKIRITIDNYRYVYNKDDENDNIYIKITRKDWNTFKLMYGVNNVLIETKKAKINISYKEKIALM